MRVHRIITGAALVLTMGFCARAEVKIAFDHNTEGTPQFQFKNAPSPLVNDAAAQGKFTVVDGRMDSNAGGVRVLNDGRLPDEEDSPAANFFFQAGTDGGRLQLDLGRVTEVKQVNSFSWHPGERGPQVYQLYGADGAASGFSAAPQKGTDPANCGWTLIAKVDTRPREGAMGGQYGVSIADTAGLVGKYRYLLFDIVPTETEDGFGNTFFSEIDVVDTSDTPAVLAGTSTPAGAEAAGRFVARSADGYCSITIDTSGAPELTEWAEKKLAPVLSEWYPKLTTMLASDGYAPPKQFSVTIRPGQGVAATGGGGVTANSTWLKGQLNGEAIGALVHEEVHVVQRYGGGRRNNPDYRPAPGWVTEGIPDYIRWFLYEPQSHGADVEFFKKRPNTKFNYDGAYRITANFMNYVVEHYDKEKTLITKLNAVSRQGRYTDDFWKETTGKTLSELNDEWKAALKKEFAKGEVSAAPGSGSPADTTGESRINMLSEAEKAAGWKLLFNGRDFNGWHNFKREGVRPGWEVKDGSLVCADPHNAGDIVTADQYDWFELQLDYNISAGGNSGIMYHVTDAGGAAWATGPEFQLEDNKAAADPVRCGWLYALYQPPNDPKTGKPLDATKPAGEWNHVRLLITPQKCEHEINGVKYFDYVLGSEDFNARVAKSKFGSMKDFAKFTSGSIALQGDHGQISFRNIKIRPVAASR